MPEELTPTDYLVMEVLAARFRLGEASWTFPTYIKPALKRLEALNYLGWKSGVAEKTCLAWMSDVGKKAWKLNQPYKEGQVYAG